MAKDNVTTIKGFNVADARKEAEKEIQEELMKKAKARLKAKLQEEATALQVLTNIRRELAELEHELSAGL